MELVARLLEYTPSLRMTPLEACAHSFFKELREQGTRLPNGRELPPLFNFTEHELRIQPTLNSQLIPKYIQPSDGSQPAVAATDGAIQALAAAQPGTQAASGTAESSDAQQSSPTGQANAAAQNVDPSQSSMA